MKRIVKAFTDPAVDSDRSCGRLLSSGCQGPAYGGVSRHHLPAKLEDRNLAAAALSRLDPGKLAGSREGVKTSSSPNCLQSKVNSPFHERARQWQGTFPQNPGWPASEIHQGRGTHLITDR